MAKAKRVHSTPRRTASKIQVIAVETFRDLSYRRLEERVNDLDRLCEITMKLVHQWVENLTSERCGSVATVMAEITHDRMQEFK
jgi:hypothetical protein